MKKFTLVIMSVMICTILYGCGEKEAASEEEYVLPTPTFEVDESVPSWQIDDSEAELTWYINYDWFTPPEWGGNLATQYITEDTGVTIVFDTGTDVNLNTMIAAGDLPDIITVDATDPLVEEASEWAIPLDELAAMYDPYFIKTAAKPEALNYYTTEDGHIYGYPNYTITQSDYEQGGLYGNTAFLVREDIYVALGEPDMSTPEAFLDTLRMVDESEFTNDIGHPVIPFGTNTLRTQTEVRDFCNTLADMIGIPLTTEDGEYYDRYADEDFQLWLSTIAKAYREGLVDTDMLVMDDEMNNEKIANGSYFCFLQTDISGDTVPMMQRYEENPDAAYIAVDGPMSTVGRETIVQTPSPEGWTLTFVTEDCDNPQKAMEFITYMVSPYGDMVMNFGREGETYTMVDGKPVLDEDLVALKENDPDKYEEEVGLGNYIWLSDGAMVSRQTGLSQFPVALQQQKEWTQQYLYYTGATSDIDDKLSDEEYRNLQKIDNYWSSTFGQIMTAESDSEVEQVFEDFEKYKDEHGWDEIVDARTEQIQYNMEKSQSSSVK